MDPIALNISKSFDVDDFPIIVESVASSPKPSSDEVNKILTSKEVLKKANGKFCSLSYISGPRTRSCCDSAKPEDYYALFKVISIGRFSVFYSSMELGNNTPRTLKVFRPSVSRSAVRRASLEKSILNIEMKPKVIPNLFSAFSFEFQNCLVLEMMSGISLQDKVRFARRMSPAAIHVYMAEITLAVSFLHSKSIVHRNLNLTCFWVQHNGHLKLIDYCRCLRNDTCLPKLAWICYPSYYTAPEALGCHRVSKMVDIWAMGIIMYRMTTGRMPYYAPTRSALKRAIKYDLVDYSYFFTIEAKNLCMKLLTRAPSFRIGYGQSTFQALETDEYFSATDWDAIMLEAHEAPPVPIMFATRGSSDGDKEMQLVLYHDGVKLKKKPLRFDDISKRHASKLFSEAYLHEMHRRTIAREVKRQKARPPVANYSFLKIVDSGQFNQRQNKVSESDEPSDSETIPSEPFTTISQTLDAEFKSLQENLHILDKEDALKIMKLHLYYALVLLWLVLSPNGLQDNKHECSSQEKGQVKVVQLFETDRKILRSLTNVL